MARPLEDAMRRYARGEDAALGDVYDGLAPQLHTFLVRLARNEALAEDLVQETFLRIVRARASYREGAAVTPWAYAIARRLFLDSERSKRRSPVQLDPRPEEERPSDPGVATDTAPADEQLVAKRLAERIEAVLARLPENQATAFRLLKQEGMSVAEAAEIVGTTQNGVKLRAHRAYEALREALGAEIGALRGDAA